MEDKLTFLDYLVGADSDLTSRLVLSSAAFCLDMAYLTNYILDVGTKNQIRIISELDLPNLVRDRGQARKKFNFIFRVALRNKLAEIGATNISVRLHTRWIVIRFSCEILDRLTAITKLLDQIYGGFTLELVNKVNPKYVDLVRRVKSAIKLGMKSSVISPEKPDTLSYRIAVPFPAYYTYDFKIGGCFMFGDLRSFLRVSSLIECFIDIQHLINILKDFGSIEDYKAGEKELREVLDEGVKNNLGVRSKIRFS